MSIENDELVKKFKNQRIDENLAGSEKQPANYETSYVEEQEETKNLEEQFIFDVNNSKNPILD